ncbi:unnamed protein product [marine sediment metagenome]|uniref:Guanylate cyclase domain-containing protein n=1 Tax=marine sediment metagenome TaxID=412755 RepID=X1RFH6_9ZZZZ
MPINNFDGNTFVAFLDISGFKQLMKDGKRAWEVLDRLYNNGYKVLKEVSSEVEGIFISDSGVLFVRNCQNKKECLTSLLEVIKKINRGMLDYDIMLTTSIAYGRFKYQERIEFVGIEKKPIYGNAYLSAFIDNENGKPKIQPGQCRIVGNNLPQDIKDVLNNDYSEDKIIKHISKRDRNNHYYFYWMVENPLEIDKFEKQYTDAYNLKYAGMLKALKIFIK